MGQQVEGFSKPRKQDEGGKRFSICCLNEGGGTSTREVRSSLQASWLASDPPQSPRKLELFGRRIAYRPKTVTQKMAENTPPALYDTVMEGHPLVDYPL